MSQSAAAPRLFLCDCLGSQSVDPGTAAPACGATAESPATHLCRREIGRVSQALEAGAQVIVACGQEVAVFADLAEELGASDRLTCVDIRDRAGWSDEGAQAGPKQAALLAMARVSGPATPALTLKSDGALLILGAADVAIPAAEKVADRLGVTVMLPAPEEAVPPSDGAILVTTGRVAQASGWLGAFGVKVAAFAEAEPAGRGGLRFGRTRDGAQTECDLILDLTGGAPLFPAHEKRDGYLRADPRDPVAVAEALLKATALVGEFEKPLYVDFDAGLCAHTRARKQGCDRCLQVCPASAIVPDGDAVRIDPNICAGCGACAAVCPSGAASYAYPPLSTQWRRLDAMAQAWRAAGGRAFRLLLHDAAGLELIEASARFGRGLPADAIPFALNQATMAEHGHMLAALAMGASEVVVHLHPRKADEADALKGQIALANALATGAGLPGARARLVETDDPDALEAALWVAPPAPHKAQPITPLGTRRAVTRQAVRALGASTGSMKEAIDLPADLFPSGPPYGEIKVNTEACTLCLACVSVCPSGALLDNADRPQLRFIEDACLQCGICANACPENAIALAPRYLTTAQATAPQVLNEEEPFACVDCGKLFGVKSTIEKISEKLADKHWMFGDDKRVRMIQMCDDCRIRAQYHSDNNPFAFGTRPRMRTTDDDLAERAASQAAEAAKGRTEH
ncbi:MAG: 4Fe-4S binding protein [Rubrimonas sp.]|uniref:4Fe-4S binding protein n=1 Tax=Rubrimonas sp. TaxID=2036015 RepID=UPI002FDD5536